MEKAAEKLQEIVSREGWDYLTDFPWEVYRELLKTKAAKKADAAIILMSLVTGVPTAARKESDAKKLAVQIERKTGFKTPVAERLADLYELLCSPGNTEALNEKHEAGMRAFLSKDWQFSWDGEENWEFSGGYLPCEYHAEILFRPIEEEIRKTEIQKRLDKNPYLTEEQIDEFFAERLAGILDREFREYVTEDDYYEPVVEDFEAETYAKEWAEKNGFEMISFEGDGDTGEYETRGRRW